jgi:hypothetical protein
MFREYSNLTAGKADQYLNNIINDMSPLIDSIGEDYKIYGRVKGPYSIFDKLYRYWGGKKNTKNRHPDVIASLNRILRVFDSNISNRIELCKELSESYQNEEIKWIIPDYFAITIQFNSDLVKNKNIGSTKSKYMGIYNKLEKNLISNIYYGPSYSEKWHMNRLVFYTLFTLSDKIRIPGEVFIRTDYDYFIGYANYWRYKNIHLLERTNSIQSDEHFEMLRKIKNCHEFREVQELIFDEITKGQLLMF